MFVYKVSKGERYMRKQIKKIAFSVFLSMAVSLVAPSQMSALASTKTFEYAEEKTGESRCSYTSYDA